MKKPIGLVYTHIDKQCVQLALVKKIIIPLKTLTHLGKVCYLICCPGWLVTGENYEKKGQKSLKRSNIMPWVLPFMGQNGLRKFAVLSNHFTT